MADLDKFEVRILDILQKDATRSTIEIAEEIGLSQAPCWRRIQRLKEAGYIRKQVALLDRKKLGLNVQIFALVNLTATGRGNISEFVETVQEFPEVLECHLLMGATDFLLRIVVRDIDAYERFYFNKLSQVPGIQEINTMVEVSEPKSTTEIPLDAAFLTKV
jgi:Lrp/AsnC family transcriptional regulator